MRSFVAFGKSFPPSTDPNKRPPSGLELSSAIVIDWLKQARALQTHEHSFQNSFCWALGCLHRNTTSKNPRLPIVGSFEAFSRILVVLCHIRWRGATWRNERRELPRHSFIPQRNEASCGGHLIVHALFSESWHRSCGKDAEVCWETRRQGTDAEMSVLVHTGHWFSLLSASDETLLLRLQCR